MEIVVTHLSKFGGTRACLAGVDLDTYGFVRVKQDNGYFPTRDDLAVAGGPIALGDVIAFDAVPLYVTAPHRENVGFAPGSLEILRHSAAAFMSEALGHVACGSLADGFDGEPVQDGHGRSCRFTEAANSLCIITPDRVTLDLADFGHGDEPRVRWWTGELKINSPLDDIRLYPDGQLDLDAFDQIDAQVDAADQVFLACSIGGWHVAPSGSAGYWLLVAGVHALHN